MTEHTLEDMMLASDIHKKMMEELLKVGKHAKDIEHDFSITILSLVMTCCGVMRTYNVSKRMANQFMADIATTAVKFYDTFKDNASVIICDGNEIQHQEKHH